MPCVGNTWFLLSRPALDVKPPLTPLQGQAVVAQGAAWPRAQGMPHSSGQAHRAGAQLGTGRPGPIIRDQWCRRGPWVNA